MHMNKDTLLDETLSDLDKALDERDDLLAENARLREALEGLVKEARAALKGRV